MIILYLLLILIAFPKVKLAEFHSDYLSLKSTNAIKGIFAVLILCTHLESYLVLSNNWFDIAFLTIRDYLAQLIVAVFFFYSGYGIIYSISHKESYPQYFFRKRLLKVLLHFDFAVLCYIILQLCLDRTYSISDYLLSCIGWVSVGNSNWFIFVILALYFATFISLRITSQIKQQYKTNAIIILIAIYCALLWLVLVKTKPGMYWWFDTIATFPLGMCYAVYANRIESKLSYSKYWWPSFVFILILFLAWHRRFGVDVYGICSAIFCILITIGSMRIKLNNIILQWLGTYSFSLYIMQRWPMLILVHFGLNKDCTLFVCISIPLALMIAFLFQHLLNKIDKRLFC